MITNNIFVYTRGQIYQWDFMFVYKLKMFFFSLGDQYHHKPEVYEWYKGV